MVMLQSSLFILGPLFSNQFWTTKIFSGNSISYKNAENSLRDKELVDQLKGLQLAVSQEYEKPWHANAGT
jgi:hypothetical protein